MKPASLLCALPLLTLTIATESAAKDSASGTFNYNDKSYAPTTAVGWREGTFLKVVLSDKPFDPALGKDGRYDDSDLMAHPSGSMTITIDAQSRELFGVRFRDDRGSGADFRCEGPGLLTLTRADATSIAGKFKCEEHDVTFDAPVLKTP
jgi:hypothetical protein